MPCLIQIRFVGDGPEKKSLIRLAKELKSGLSITWYKAQIPDLMAEADAILRH